MEQSLSTSNMLTIGAEGRLFRLKHQNAQQREAQWQMNCFFLPSISYFSGDVSTSTATVLSHKNLLVALRKRSARSPKPRMNGTTSWGGWEVPGLTRRGKQLFRLIRYV